MDIKPPYAVIFLLGILLGAIGSKLWQPSQLKNWRATEIHEILRVEHEVNYEGRRGTLVVNISTMGVQQVFVQHP